MKEVTLDYKEDPVFVKTIRTEGVENLRKAISGLAIVDTELYITTFHISVIEVYDLKSLILVRSFILGHIRPWDLGYCQSNNCLYVMDARFLKVEKEIIKFDRNGKWLGGWTTGMSYGCISVAYDGNILMAGYHDNIITEYTSDGEIVLRIDLTTRAGFVHPRHAIKLTGGRYLMSHGEGDDPLHQVCVLETSGNILKFFGQESGATSDRLYVPIYLARDSAGSIIVVDRDNSRVLLLNSGLEFAKVIIPRKRLGIDRPERMAFDEENGRLFLAHNDVHWEECRVFVFEILQ